MGFRRGGVEGIWKETDWCWDKHGVHSWEGKQINFWTDVWCKGTRLSQNFPHLFAMAAYRNATVEEMELATCSKDYKPSMEEDSVCGREEGMANLGSKKLIDWWSVPMILFFLLDAFGGFSTNQGCILCLGGYMGEGAHS
ncbi:hypothetical protein CK203_090760 [Vitis vinifera]|uniref:Uncharacterized protein n=1 Tax=Vitis vinifera TaxID=29760 RepID=A0A438BUC6_VITVI|nr:hypothetical protein CK203_090760 [Vitis vinifera]